MKILCLLILVFSLGAHAHDWQYSVKYPDGKVEIKKVTNSEAFMFNVKDVVCSVGPNEEEGDDEEDYEFTCMGKEGIRMTFDAPGPNVASETINASFYDDKNRKFHIEVTCFNYFSDKSRKPFFGGEP